MWIHPRGEQRKFSELQHAKAKKGPHKFRRRGLKRFFVRKVFNPNPPNPRKKRGRFNLGGFRPPFFVSFPVSEQGQNSARTPKPNIFEHCSWIEGGRPRGSTPVRTNKPTNHKRTGTQTKAETEAKLGRFEPRTIRARQKLENSGESVRVGKPETPEKGKWS